MPTGNTRLYRRNRAAGSASTSLALTVVPAQDPDGPALNLLNSDRYSVWKCPNTGGDQTLLLDLGVSTAIDRLGVMNLLRSGGAGPNAIIVTGYDTWPQPSVAGCVVSGGTLNKIDKAGGGLIAAGVKPGQFISGHANIPVGAFVLSRTDTQVTMNTNATAAIASFTAAFSDTSNIGSFSVAGTKNMAQSITRFTKRYWEFTFTFVLNEFSLGHLVLLQDTTNPKTDLGIVWSAGSVVELVPHVTELATASGAAHDIRHGIPTLRWKMLFNAVDSTIKDACEAMMDEDPATSGLPILVDGWGGAYEVRVRSVASSHRWGNPDLWDIVMEVEELP